ncbi:hypothetical protein GUJ93_ZPchr0829g2826 [Zizania palustris]|uniref:60S ribosomal protein L6 n=1 Tax=Zizania palustris TaxID=103762 RepID=A0A8J5RE63_ZIZPA|nr:hypothetical protein GUJ93_ZPchr0829g2826 [Zizania palustris]
MAPTSKLSHGIKKASRSHTYHRRGLWAIKAKHGGAFPKAEKTDAAAAAPKFYPADDVKPHQPSTRKPNPTKLRSSITPGTVLILLAGRFMGKRVVFLKQLKSGLLLVTGPFTINGVPIRRVNQAYCIATSSKVDISGVDVEKINDKYFARDKKKKAKKTDSELFETEKEATKDLPEFKRKTRRPSMLR